MDALPHAPPFSGMSFSHLTPAQESVIRDFGSTLELCKFGLTSSPSFTLWGNIDILFGSAMARDLLAKQLQLEFGRQVDISVSDDGLQTIVQIMPETALSHPSSLPNFNPPAFTSSALPQTTNPARTSSAIRKNPPRPMNCWMLYRDTRHKQLKDQHPHLTVQQICK